MHASSVYRLRQALKLDPPGTPVKVTEVYQMLGEIGPDLQDALGVDAVALGSEESFFGFKFENWKPWTTFDDTPVLVPGGFNTEPDEKGDILMYPEDDRSVAPSGRMPKGGFYFDSTVRQEPIDDDNLNVEDNLEEYGPISDEQLQYFAAEADRVHRESDRGQLRRDGPFISPASYRKLFQPFHAKVNDWVHEHTPWKTFIHSCGSIIALMPDLIEAGFDVFNPIQCSATGMDQRTLKDQFGDKITFWGGGVDTQETLPFGTPEEICQQVRKRIEIFGHGGGFVFNTIHNVQAGVPAENLVALYEAVRDFR